MVLTSFVAATYEFGIYLFAQLVADMRVGLDRDTGGAITAAGQFGYLFSAVLAAWLTSYGPSLQRAAQSRPSRA